jgi:carboxypeptidase PM20D1
VSADDPAFLYVAEAMKASFAIPVAPQMTIAYTDSSHYAAIADAVLRSWPFPLDPADLPRIHGTDERIAVESLGPAVGFYMRLMRDLK